MILKDNKILFVTIDQRYLRALYDACNEVFYRTYDYDRKPYVGILVTINGNKYAIPLSLAKEKHKTWKNYDNGRMVVFETVNPSAMGPNDIWKLNQDGTVKHILSILNIAKMIPLKEGLYSVIDINLNQSDTIEQTKYKNLLNKELQFCITNKEKIIRESGKIYSNQISTGIVYFSYCDFKKLEKARDNYIDNNTKTSKE